MSAKLGSIFLINYVLILIVEAIRSDIPYEPGDGLAAQKEFPFMVSIRLPDDSSKTLHMCGGVLLNQAAVLTSLQCTMLLHGPVKWSKIVPAIEKLHWPLQFNQLCQHIPKIKKKVGCFIKKEVLATYDESSKLSLIFNFKNLKKDLTVHAGTVHSRGTDDESTAKTSTVKSLLTGSSALTEGTFNLAVIILNQPLKRQEGIDYADLVTKKSPCPKTCTSIGWGDHRKRVIPHLFKGRIKIERCYGGLVIGVARNLTFKRKDLGSPLICNGYVYGITNVVNPDIKGHPTGFSELWKYMDFIASPETYKEPNFTYEPCAYHLFYNLTRTIKKVRWVAELQKWYLILPFLIISFVAIVLTLCIQQ